MLAVRESFVKVLCPILVDVRYFELNLINVSKLFADRFGDWLIAVKCQMEFDII